MNLWTLSFTREAVFLSSMYHIVKTLYGVQHETNAPTMTDDIFKVFILALSILLVFDLLNC